MGQGNQGIQSHNSRKKITEDSQSAMPKVSKTQGTPANGTKPPNKISNVVTKFSFATKGGIAAHNPYKTNQDAYITSPHIMGLKHCHFFSVCDGHGQNGREVSGLLKHRLPFHIENQMKKNLGTHDLVRVRHPAARLLRRQAVCSTARGPCCRAVHTLRRR